MLEFDAIGTAFGPLWQPFLLWRSFYPAVCVLFAFNLSMGADVDSFTTGSTDTYHNFAFHDPLFLRLTVYVIYTLETTQTTACIIEAVNQFSANIGTIEAIYANRPTWPCILLVTSTSTCCPKHLHHRETNSFASPISYLHHPYRVCVPDKSPNARLEGADYYCPCKSSLCWLGL